MAKVDNYPRKQNKLQESRFGVSILLSVAVVLGKGASHTRVYGIKQIVVVVELPCKTEIQEIGKPKRLFDPGPPLRCFL